MLHSEMHRRQTCGSEAIGQPLLIRRGQHLRLSFDVRGIHLSRTCPNPWRAILREKGGGLVRRKKTGWRPFGSETSPQIPLSIRDLSTKPPQERKGRQAWSPGAELCPVTPPASAPSTPSRRPDGDFGSAPSRRHGSQPRACVRHAALQANALRWICNPGSITWEFSAGRDWSQPPLPIIIAARRPDVPCARGVSWRQPLPSSRYGNLLGLGVTRARC